MRRHKRITWPYKAKLRSSKPKIRSLIYLKSLKKLEKTKRSLEGQIKITKR